MSFKHSFYGSHINPLAGLFVVLMGLLFLGGAAWSAKNTYTLVTEGVHADGTVTDVIETWETERRKGEPDRTVLKFRYMVEFRDGMGNRVEFKDSIVDSTRSHEKGDKVPVLYLRDDAADSATIDHGAMNWILPGVLGIFGLVFSVSGAFALKGIRKRAV